MELSKRIHQETEKDKYAACWKCQLKKTFGVDFPTGPVIKNPPSNTGDEGLIPAGELRFPLICCVVWPKYYIKERKYSWEKKLAGRIHLSISSNW